MRRRHFLGTLGGAAAALHGSVRAAGQQPAASSVPAGNDLEILAVRPGDLDAYFSEEKLRQAINTTASLSGIQFEVVSYNFPSWHPSPFMEQRFGKGWTEFDTLRNAKPLYPGHQMPRYPLWGYFNEADPEWAAREIDTASEYGIDAWMIDWYWHNGTQFYQEQLENGFLKAPNRQKLKFAVMWANHHWKNVYPARSPDQAAVILPQEHSEADALRVIDYCTEHYFHEPNYWRIEGRPVFAIFDLSLFVDALGKDGTQRAFDKMRGRVSKAGLGDLHIQASHVYAALGAELKSLGVDSAAQYHTFAWTYGGRPPGGRSPYGDGAIATIESWKTARPKLSVPFYPDCPVGWDDSPRFGNGTHFVIDRTPDQYARLLGAARYFSAASAVKPHVIFLSAWNEWTEDHVLLPDTVYGYSYLEAVRSVFGSKGRPE